MILEAGIVDMVVNSSIRTLLLVTGTASSASAMGKSFLTSAMCAIGLGNLLAKYSSL